MKKYKEFFGFGSLKKLDKLLDKYHPKKILLFSGKSSFGKSGAKFVLTKTLKHYRVSRFSDFSDNPKLSDIKKGIRAHRKFLPDLSIAVGGGSVIDLAKLVNFFSPQSRSIDYYVKSKENTYSKPKPLIAIPTTSGSGSEATHFAVFYRNKVKYSVSNKYLLPEAAIIDPQLSTSMDEYLTACTGMDAFCQAVESYWSVASNRASKKLAKRAINLVLNNIVRAVKSPSRSSRKAMSLAAHLAGKAINITKTTVSHALSYPLTSYFGIPHGHAVALTIGEALIFNSRITDPDSADTRGSSFVKKSLQELYSLMGCRDAHSCRDKIYYLMREINLETSLSKLGVKTKRQLMVISRNANLERLANNPRRISPGGIMNILRNIH